MGEAGAVVDPAQLDAVMAGARAFVAVIVESSARVDGEITPQQLRMLVLIRAHRGTNLSALAGWMDVHPSSATRVCDRLVRAGLVARTAQEDDRRNVHLDLTRQGARLLERITAGRRRAMDRVMRRMPEADRARLGRSLSAFAAAAGDVHGDGLWPVLPDAGSPAG